MTNNPDMSTTDKFERHYRQQLSALVDGELSAEESRFLLRRLAHDEELAGCQERWQLCGDVLRCAASAPAPLDFAAKVRAAVAEEPAPAAAPAARPAARWRWGGGAALAASVAAIALFVSRERLPEVAAPAPAEQVFATTARLPASTPAPQAPKAPDAPDAPDDVVALAAAVPAAALASARRGAATRNQQVARSVAARNQQAPARMVASAAARLQRPRSPRRRQQTRSRILKPRCRPARGHAPHWRGRAKARSTPASVKAGRRQRSIRSSPPRRRSLRQAEHSRLRRRRTDVLAVPHPFGIHAPVTVSGPCNCSGLGPCRPAIGGNLMNPRIRTQMFGLLAMTLPLAACAQQPEAPAKTSAPIAANRSTTPAPQLVAGLPDFTNLVEQVGPGVVNIETTITRKDAMARSQRGGPGGRGGGAMPDDEQMPEFFKRFFGPDFQMPGGPRQGPGQGDDDGGIAGKSMGSGFIISADGYVLTNHHVVDGASEVTVKLTDRREFKAKVVGSDEQFDVALLKIEAKGLPTVRIGDSNTLKPGQWVVAIGSPFGLDHSVTAGIVSATGRSNPYADQRYVPFIQTDVAINQATPVARCSIRAVR